MRVFMLLLAAALSTTACHSKSSTPPASGSAESTPKPVAGSGSAVAVAEPGSAAQGSAEPTPAAGSGSATAGSAAAADPRIAALSAEEKRACGVYASCKVAGLRDDDPKAPEKEPQFENECLAVWVTLPEAEKKKIAKCADAVGQCQGPPECFDSMKLNP